YIRVNEYSTAGTLGNFTICATPVPNCPVPTGLATGTITNTTAVLNWVSATAGSTYTVIYGPAGFTPPSGTGSTTVTGITGLTTTITGLQPSTNYAFYVQQVCGGFNGSSTLAGPIAFATPLTPPANDDPCGATAFGNTAVTGSNVGATTTAGPANPVCSTASSPKDVWFSFVPNATSTTLTLTGAAAGTVRVYSAASCSATLNLLICSSSGASNTALTAPVTVTGLTTGTRYYVAVSGYGSNDTAGSFTIAGTNLATPTATRTKADTDALLVYPNPSNTGQLTLKLSGINGVSQASLLNALGQVVLTKNLTGTAEQTLSTRNLAVGLYTLRVEAGSQVLTRKVVLE
ncbi:T9SS type A sorting domain-containing protein, partial [Hymenobacter negativus]